MPRTFSATMIQAMLSRTTGEEFVLLLTLSHASFPTPIRRALRRTSLISRSNTFFPHHFEPELPSQEEGQIPRWRVTMDAVDQTILRDLRALSSRPDILVEGVLVSAPDTVQYTTGPGYKVFGYTFTRYVLTLEAAMANLQGAGFPGGRIKPSNFPGGF